MSSKRTGLPTETEKEVLTRSKRRCCICFGLERDLGVKKGQIAHLDKNRDNHKIDNLAFLCLPHHDEYDSVTSQSKSLRLSEVKHYREELYNSLGSIVPEESSTEDIQNELTKSVLLEISLVAHSWKNNYMTIYPGHFMEGTFERTKTYVDVWDMMIDVSSLKYSTSEWKKYLPLFSKGIERTSDKLERIIMMFPDRISPNIKLAILRTNLQLSAEFTAYLYVPQLAKDDASLDKMFIERFRSVLRSLGELSRLADREKDQL